MLSLLFLKRTNKEGLFRYFITIFSVTISVMILLSCISIAQALIKTNNDEALITYLKGVKYTKEEIIKNKKNATAFDIETTEYKNKMIKTISVYKMNEKSPNFIGLNSTPTKDELFVSKSLEKLIKNDEILAERFKGYKLKIIDTYGVTNPDGLLVVKQISDKKIQNTRFSWFNEDDIKIEKKNLRENESSKNKIIFTMLWLVGLGISFPLFMLIISSTRIGIKQRESRYAALSLIGTSKRQINRILVAESLSGTMIGIIIASLLYENVCKPLLSQYEIGFYDRFYKQDLQIPTITMIAILIFIILTVVVVNYLALRKVKTSPLGVIKRQNIPKKPTILRALPLMIPIIYFAYIFYKKGDKAVSVEDTNNFVIFTIIIFVITMISLLLLNSYTTYLVSLLIGKFSKKATSFMASKRLKIFAKSLTHSVNGIVLALFVGSFLLTGFSILEKTVKYQYKNFMTITDINKKAITPETIEVSAYLKNVNEKNKLPDETEYIEKIKNEIIGNKEISKYIKEIYKGLRYYDDKRGEVKIYTCDELKRRTQFECPTTLNNEDLVEVEFYNKGDNPDNFEYEVRKIDKIPKNAKENKYNFKIILKDIRYKDEVIERVNNIAYKITNDEPIDYGIIPYNEYSINEILSSKIGKFINLIYIGTIATIFIGGFSLSICSIGGFFERKKSFANLRLIGVDLKTLYKTVLIESFIPMIIPSMIASISGILFANVMLKYMDERIVSALPNLLYLGIILISFIIVISIMFATLPILKRITEPEKNITE